MEDFDPKKLRDWEDLDSLYKHPEGSPSNAQEAGEQLLQYCDIHKTPIKISPMNLGASRVLKDKTEEDQDINNVRKDPKVEEI